MFAEDVELLPKHSFTERLDSLPPSGEGFEDVLRQLFREMNAGTGKGISVVLRKKLLQFNGGLFADDTVLPINGLQLGLLKNAARQHWGSVEPAIFGTLLERALNPDGRHQLGAHFTPRAYVERLVLPTVIEPLRAEWGNVRVAAVTHARAGDLKKARAEVNAFHERLCRVTVLDPACGTANFLYVALQHLKILEGEVLDFAAQFGENFRLELGETHTIDPHQFLGIELNPRAASVAELVLWIGYLQWHFKIHGERTPPEPILRAFKNIQCRDAVLAYDGDPQPAKDEDGQPLTIWDRQSNKTDMVTGRAVPDETKRVPLLTYTNPRPAQWPAADHIVGNPPFIGNKRMRDGLGGGYCEALRESYPEMSGSVDFVMYWWHKAAELVRAGKVKRFGLITTNSITQTFSRRVVQSQLAGHPPLSLVFAIPDHPWVDTADGAAVRIAITVGISGTHEGELLQTCDEQPQDDGSVKLTFVTQQGRIQPDITTGAQVGTVQPLRANDGLCWQGCKLVGGGFQISQEEFKALVKQQADSRARMPSYWAGSDVTQERSPRHVVDLFGLELEQARQRFLALLNHIAAHVKPERDQNRDRGFRERWWLFGRPRPDLREACAELRRYIVTSEVAKHRTFTFLRWPGDLIDGSVIAIASDDACTLGVLSCRIHVTWALAAGAMLEDRPRYQNGPCFDPFPFPVCSPAQADRIRQLAEELDAHRKRAQAQHGLTLTGLYNVLEKLRAASASPAALPHPNPNPLPLGEGTAPRTRLGTERVGSTPALAAIPPLPAGEGRGEGERVQPSTAPPLALMPKEKLIHDAGLVSVLKQLHDDLDRAVADAYGWPWPLRDEEILTRLVALNAERAAEEARGLIRWLRPEYQMRNAERGMRHEQPV